jgi:hypothetical protein
MVQSLEERGAGEFNGLGYETDVGNVELGHHDTANVVFRVGDEFVDEDVVVNCVADTAADNANGEG